MTFEFSLVKSTLSTLLVVLAIGFSIAAPKFGFAEEGLVENDQISADTLFVADRLIEIEIELAEADWNEIRTQSRSFGGSLGKLPAESPFTYVKGNIKIDGQLIKDVGIRKKGFIGSLDERRPSLKVKFSEYVNQTPVTGLDRLTLNNNKQDSSRICQYLAYKLFRDSGTKSPRCGFAKVTVNGDYLGIYANVESVRSEFLKRNFGDGTGDYFEGTVCDFYPGWIQKFEPKTQNANLAPIIQVADIMQDDPIDLPELKKAVDIDAFINYWAMESLIGFWDSYCSNQNNYFVYQNPGNVKLYFIPWGADSAFTKTTPLPPFRIRPRAVHSKAVLPNKLYRIPEVQQQYLDTLKSFLDEHWQEDQVLAEIDRLEELLRPHVLESNKKFDSELKKYRSFVKSRRSDLAREWRKGPPELPSRESMPAYLEEIGTATISFTTRWYDKTPSETLGLGDVDIELELHGEKVIIEDAGVYAERSKWPTPDPVKPPSIVFVGTRKSDGKHLTLGTGTSIDQFKPNDGKATATIGGIFIEDKTFFNFEGMRMISGTATFTKAAMQDGQPVQGKMELKIAQFQGGKPVADKED